MPTPVRRLHILPCHVDLADLAPAPGGGHCPHCDCLVHDAGALHSAELEALIEQARHRRVCLRSELVDGRPRLAGATIAAGLLVVALAGCATPTIGDPPGDPPVLEPRARVTADLPAHGDAAIEGVVRDRDGAAPLAGALVVLQSAALQRERVTDHRGVYRFVDLPAGEYTIQVLVGRSATSKVTRLPEGARFRANFSVDPEGEALMGVIVVEPTVPLDASSTYRSGLVWIED